MIFNLNCDAKKVTEDAFAYSGNYLFATDGKTFELALLSSGTLRFKGYPGLVELCLVAGGRPGGTGSGVQYDVHGGDGGDGGEVINLQDVRLRHGVDYAVSIGGSEEATAVTGGDLNETAGSGPGVAGGSGAIVSGLSRTAPASAGADGSLAFGSESSLITVLSGRKYGAGGGGADVCNTDYVHANSINHGGSNSGGATGGGDGGARIYNATTGQTTGERNGTDGMANTGAGGGGAWYNSSDLNDSGKPGAGGSGILIIRGRSHGGGSEPTGSDTAIADQAIAEIAVSVSEED